VTVLTDPDASELGRFAVTENLTQVGSFKTPTLRNIDLTAPYMHDGSLQTLEDVVEFYDHGGRLDLDDPLSGFLSGGIRPLGLSDEQEADLIAFLKSLTSPNVAGTPSSALASQ
jgi:cytochrome c peroxidase